MVIRNDVPMPRKSFVEFRSWCGPINALSEWMLTFSCDSSCATMCATNSEASHCWCCCGDSVRTIKRVRQIRANVIKYANAKFNGTLLVLRACDQIHKIQNMWHFAFILSCRISSWCCLLSQKMTLCSERIRPHVLWLGAWFALFLFSADCSAMIIIYSYYENKSIWFWTAAAIPSSTFFAVAAWLIFKETRREVANIKMHITRQMDFCEQGLLSAQS